MRPSVAASSNANFVANAPRADHSAASTSTASAAGGGNFGFAAWNDRVEDEAGHDRNRHLRDRALHQKSTVLSVLSAPPPTPMRRRRELAPAAPCDSAPLALFAVYHARRDACRQVVIEHLRHGHGFASEVPP